MEYPYSPVILAGHIKNLLSIAHVHDEKSLIIIDTCNRIITEMEGTNLTNKTRIPCCCINAKMVIALKSVLDFMNGNKNTKSEHVLELVNQIFREGMESDAR